MRTTKKLSTHSTSKKQNFANRVKLSQKRILDHQKRQTNLADRFFER